MKKEAALRSCLQPRAEVLVSCRSKEGQNNALAVAYCCNCSYDPPMVMVGIVPSRFSYHIIKETGCFVVNLVSKEQKGLFDYMGSHSGKNEDKLATFKAAWSEAEKIRSPLLSDCPVNIECEVVDSIKTGSHEMFVGKVLCVHADQALVDEKGGIDFSRIDFI